MQIKHLNEVVLLKSEKTKNKKNKQQQLDFDLKLKLNGKRLYPTNSGKYPGIKIGDHLTWKPHIAGMPAKRSKTNSMFSIIRHYVNMTTLPCYIRNTFILFLFGLDT